MEKFKRILFITGSVLIMCLLLVGCNFKSKQPANCQAFENVDYVEFDKNFSLTKGDFLDLNILGITSVSIMDSIMIVSSKNDKGMWSIFKLNNDPEFLGSHLNVGRAMDEVLYPIYVIDHSLFYENGDLISLIVKKPTREALKFNITKSIENKNTHIERMDYNLHMDNQGYRGRFVTKDVYVATEFVFPELADRISRYYVKDDKKEVSENMQILNNAAKINATMDPNKINLLGAFIESDKKGETILEVPLFLNYINLYSLYDSSFSKTICTGDRMVSIDDIQEEKELINIFSYYNGVTSFDDYFGVLCQNDSDGNFINGVSKKMEILFFDWTGNPLCSVNIDTIFTSFDIDFKNKELYTACYVNDEVRRYDISQVLDFLDNKIKQ